MKLRRRERAGSGFTGRSVKNPLVQFAGVFSYVIMLVMRIPLARAIGDAGVGLFAPAYEIFFLITLFTSDAMTGALSGIVRYRVKREQYRNAKRVFRAAFFLDLIISAAAAVILVVFSAVIANIFVLEALSRTAIAACGAVLVFAAFIGIFRGYFNGYGLGMLTAHSRYIEGISMFVCVTVGARLMGDYGARVAALKQSDMLACAYGAFGAMLGVMFSQLITTLHLLVVYVIYAGTLRGKLGADNSKRMESQYYLQKMILENSIPFAVVAILSNLFMLIDQRMFNYCMNKTEQGAARTATWGAFYGQFGTLVGIGAAIGVLCVCNMTGRIGGAYEREEYRAMRDRIGKAVRKLCMTAFPTAVYLAVLAQAFVDCLSAGDNAQAAAWIREGAAIVVLYGFCYLFAQLLYRMRMMRELLFAALVSLFVHVLAAYLFVQKAYLGADGIVCALLLFFAAYAALCFLFVSRNLKYRQEWLGSVAFPAAAAGVSGVVVGLVNRLLLAQIGGGLTILIGVLTGLFFYITFLMILRVIGEAELSKMPLGFFFIMLGKNIGVL